MLNTIAAVHLEAQFKNNFKVHVGLYILEQIENFHCQEFILTRSIFNISLGHKMQSYETNEDRFRLDH